MHVECESESVPRPKFLSHPWKFFKKCSKTAILSLPGTWIQSLCLECVYEPDSFGVCTVWFAASTIILQDRWMTWCCCATVYHSSHDQLNTGRPDEESHSEARSQEMTVSAVISWNEGLTYTRLFLQKVISCRDSEMPKFKNMFKNAPHAGWD